MGESRRLTHIQRDVASRGESPTAPTERRFRHARHKCGHSGAASGPGAGCRSDLPGGHFQRRGLAELGDVLGDREHGYSYSRIDNPTSAAMAEAMAELHSAEAGFAFATGMAATHGMFVALLKAGDHVVASSALYGSVQHLIQDRLGRFGVESTFVDITDLAAVDAAFKPEHAGAPRGDDRQPNDRGGRPACPGRDAHRHGAA